MKREFIRAVISKRGGEEEGGETCHGQEVLYKRHLS